LYLFKLTVKSYFPLVEDTGLVKIAKIAPS
jgi:hypothetical protein